MNIDKSALDWNTIIVAGIISAPSMIFMLKMYRDLATKTIKDGFEKMVSAIEKGIDRAEDRHQENLMAMASLEKSVTVCRFGHDHTKKHAQNAPSRPSKSHKRVKGHSKKRSRVRAKKPRGKRQSSNP